MYKEIIISIIIIATILIGDFATQKCTKKSVDDLKEKLSSLKMDLEEQNEEETIKKVEEISHKLEEVHRVLAYYIEHDELEKMETDFTACKSYALSGEYKEAISELERTKYVMNHITDKYSFILENIF